MNEHFEKWDRLAPLGLLLIGFGIGLTGEAFAARGRGRSFFRWFLSGLLGFITLNAGIAVFGEAIKHRTLYEIDLKNLHNGNGQYGP